MPLIVLSGQPASGKTTLCERLLQKLNQRSVSVVVVDVDTYLGLSKNEAYKDGVSHKNTRAGLRSAVERELSNQKTVVILDALNNIKGCRYEVWCLARTVGTQYCVLHIEASEETCRLRNTAASQPYRSEMYDTLKLAEERESLLNADLKTCVLTEPEYGTDDSETVLDTIISHICGEGTQQTAHQSSLIPTDATSNPPLAQTNLQHDIDKAATSIVKHLTELQQEVASEAVGTVTFSSALPSLRLVRPVTVAELRRLKRGFLKLATQLNYSRVSDSDSAGRLFIEYLQQNLDP